MRMSRQMRKNAWKCSKVLNNHQYKPAEMQDLIFKHFSR